MAQESNAEAKFALSRQARALDTLLRECPAIVKLDVVIGQYLANKAVTKGWNTRDYVLGKVFWDNDGVIRLKFFNKKEVARPDDVHL